MRPPLVLLAAFLAAAGAHAQTTRLELGPDGTWVERPAGGPSEANADRQQLDEVRRLIAASAVSSREIAGDGANGAPTAAGAEGPPDPAAGERALKQAFAILNPWIETHRRTSHRLLAEAYLLRGDAWVAAGNEWKALYDYEALIKQFPGSEEFVRAVEREVEIGIRYANGLRRKQLGVRFVDATGEGQELLVRAAERMPGSALAERAQIELADSYLVNEDWELATEAYEVFLVNFPRSVHRQRAMKNLVAGHIRGYKGPRYDARGLLEARALIERFREDFPADADRALLTQELINRIDEQLASQALYRAKFHERRGDGPGARLVLRRIVAQYPGTAAAKDARKRLDARGWNEPDAPEAPTAPAPAAAPEAAAPPATRRPRRTRRTPRGVTGAGPVRRGRRGSPAVLVAVLALVGAGCSADPSKGYSLKSSYVENVRAVAVPIAENRTFSKGLEVALTEAVIKEIQRSTPWVVVGREAADAVLRTTITESSLRTLSTGRVTGMAQEVAVTLTIDFDFRLAGSGRNLISRRGFQGVGTFVAAYGTQERLELGQSVSVQKLARDIVSELRSDW